MKTKTNNQGKKLHRGRRIFLGIVLLILVSSAGSLGYFQFAPPEQTCLSCHEIQDAYDRWHTSTHREVGCKACHGGSLTSGIHGLVENAQRVIGHFNEASLGDIALSETQVVRMQQACRVCHASEFAAWQTGGHAATYADIFLDASHNEAEQPNNDCLRCHGMFFAGRISDLVTPVSTEGPWSLIESTRHDWPTIPCLACHEVHRPGPLARETKEKASDDTVTESVFAVSFYDRHEKMHFAADILPEPQLTWQGQPVSVSTDTRQRVCVQCHAPESSEHAGTSDDKTPRGVHEGLSCLACHQAHTNRADQSCAQCHPALSNCGLDVTKMDTTFVNAESPHDIHTVACADCHTVGVPSP
ncbi:MAG: NapC/NirT family cytochrome c [Phycisphaerae bacterium]|nr:NapC/NirT family cytochrome c [Phycisphaerae bacterium]